MKKLLVVTIVGLITFTSCKKDYTCSCSSDGDAWSESYSNVTEADAESKCNKKEADSKLGDPNSKCSIN